jgi:hypothetical protein
VTVFWEHPIPWSSKRKEFRTEKWVAIDSTDLFSFQFKIISLFFFLCTKDRPSPPKNKLSWVELAPFRGVATVLLGRALEHNQECSTWQGCLPHRGFASQLELALQKVEPVDDCLSYFREKGEKTLESLEHQNPLPLTYFIPEAEGFIRIQMFMFSL